MSNPSNPFAGKSSFKSMFAGGSSNSSLFGSKSSSLFSTKSKSFSSNISSQDTLSGDTSGGESDTGSSQNKNRIDLRKYEGALDDFIEEDDEVNDLEEEDIIDMSLFSDNEIIIDSMSKYVQTIRKYIDMKDWTPTLLVAELFSLQDTHVHCEFLQVS